MKILSLWCTFVADDVDVTALRTVVENFRDLLECDPTDFASSGALIGKKVTPRKKAVVVNGDTPASGKPKRAYTKRAAKKAKKDSDEDSDGDDEDYD